MQFQTLFQQFFDPLLEYYHIFFWPLRLLVHALNLNSNHVLNDQLQVDYKELKQHPYLDIMDSFLFLPHDTADCNVLASLRILSSHDSVQHIELFGIAMHTYLMHQDNELFHFLQDHLKHTLFPQSVFYNPTYEYIINLYNLYPNVLNIAQPHA